MMSFATMFFSTFSLNLAIIHHCFGSAPFISLPVNVVDLERLPYLPRQAILEHACCVEAEQCCRSGTLSHKSGSWIYSLLTYHFL